jgi:predicted O-methyltransferase YrrM
LYGNSVKRRDYPLLEAGRGVDVGVATEETEAHRVDVPAMHAPMPAPCARVRRERERETHTERERTISIKPHEAEVLANLVEKYNVKYALEIGLAYGASSMALLEASSNLKLISCDPFQKDDYNDSGLKKIQAANLQERHTHLNSFSDRALPKLLEEKASFDLIFIDGDHKFSGAFVDFHYAAQMTKVGGIVVFHDLWMRALILIRSYIKKNRKDFVEIKVGSSNMCAFQRVNKDSRDGMAFNEFYNRQGYLKYHINRLSWERKTVLGKSIFKLKTIIKKT